jgi:hypothetical protein
MKNKLKIICVFTLIGATEAAAHTHYPIRLSAVLPKSTGTDAVISCITEIYWGFVLSSHVILITRAKTTGTCDCSSWCNRAPQSLPVDFGLPSISHSHTP